MIIMAEREENPAPLSTEADGATYFLMGTIHQGMNIEGVQLGVQVKILN